MSWGGTQTPGWVVKAVEAEGEEVVLPSLCTRRHEGKRVRLRAYAQAEMWLPLRGSLTLSFLDRRLESPAQTLRISWVIH